MGAEGAATFHREVRGGRLTNMKRTQQQRIKNRGWSIPLAYAVVTLTAGMILPRLEHHFLPNLNATLSPAAAMVIYSSIASGMIALTGIVFSLAFVMVQFSASAYSPRLVLWVARDPVVSHALGVFSSTFLYALIGVAWVDRSDLGKVPLISGWLVFALLVISVAMFVALIERIGALQVNRMLIFTGEHGRRAVEELYPPAGSVPAGAAETDLGAMPVTQTLTYSGQPQAVQDIHVAELVKLAAESGAVIEIVTAVGDTVLEMTPLLRVYGARRQLDEVALGYAIEIGDERTFRQDPKYAIRILVDIAIKALSPAINDPTTAVQALDQVEDLLIRLGHRHLDIGDYRDEQGALRLVVPFPTWEDFLLLSLDEIRSCGANSVQVMRRMQALIKNLRTILPADRQTALKNWEQRLQGTIARSFVDEHEQKDASVADRQGLGIGEEK
jgi:uncharacterized membrane protein